MTSQSSKQSLYQFSPEQDEIEDVTFDDVDREYARRYHFEFIKRLWIASDDFIHGDHIELICNRIDQAIEDFKCGKSSFLLVKVPFRHSKSTIISRYLPPHFIGMFPDKEVIVATYAAALAREFSRFARDRVMLSDEYQKIFRGVQLAEKEQSVDAWGIEGREGKVRWVGLGGSITGRGGHCFPAGTMVKTEIGNVDIKTLCEMEKKPRVLAFDHKTNSTCFCSIKASANRMSSNLGVLHTQKDRSISATLDHAFYVKNRGDYVKLSELDFVHELLPIIGKDRVRSIEKLPSKETVVYDIQVEDCNNFFANEILVHNCVIIDDFFKGREEANSELMRDKIWDSICNDLLTRRPDPCIVIILATPWHMDDPFGRIERQMKEDPNFPRFEEMKFPAKSDVYKNGYLWLNKFSKEWYDSQFSTLGPYYASALLQCDPVPRGGSMFNIDKIKKYTVPPEDIAWTRGWDLASSEKSRVSPDPDYTVGIKLGVRWIASGIEGKNIPIIYVDDMIRGRWESLQRRNVISSTAVGDGEINVGIEAFGAYKDCYTEVAGILAGMRVVKKVQLPGDKVTKWADIEAAFAAGNVFIREASWNQDFIDEIGIAPDGRHDDIPDAMTVAFSLHGTNTKMVWPSFSIAKVVPLKIEWEKASSFTNLHYGALALSKDMGLHFVGALWDNRIRKLFIYRAKFWRNPNEEDVVAYLVKAMQFDKYRMDKLVGNDMMFTADNLKQSVSRQLNRKIKEKNLPEIVSVKEAIHYDFFGAVQEGEELLRTNGILIDQSCTDVTRQVLGWTLKSGKPSTEDWGFCEAICLIISELQRKKEIGEKARNVGDYHSVEKKYLNNT